MKNMLCRDFPGGSVVKKPPANAGNSGSITGPGRSHVPRGNQAHVPKLLKPECLKPMLCNEKLMQHN